MRGTQTIPPAFSYALITVSRVAAYEPMMLESRCWMMSSWTVARKR
jgi:hypothetical protein